MGDAQFASHLITDSCQIYEFVVYAKVHIWKLLTDIAYYFG